MRKLKLNRTFSHLLILFSVFPIFGKKFTRTQKVRPKKITRVPYLCENELNRRFIWIRQNISRMNEMQVIENRTNKRYKRICYQEKKTSFSSFF